MTLVGKITEAHLLNEKDKETMYQLMNAFYDDVRPDAFDKDLREKDYCILLLDEAGVIRGFSTQKIMKMEVNGENIIGVFSGDTIIHKDYWGSAELFKIFARYFINYGKQYKTFYWFLISKGYKTYKMLPLFFDHFYPNYQEKTPAVEQSIMNAFGKFKYPLEYNQKTGVICYQGVTDKLKAGVADITEKRLKDKNIQFFIQANPDYFKGNDLVCLARLEEGNLKKSVQRMLLGKL
ncbi:MAG: hypothetical protein ACOH15_09805 [Acetobacterium sp.]